MTAVSLTPSLVAITSADPWLTPLTSPLASTVATEELSVVQVTARPGWTLPFASLTVATICLCSCTTSFADSGVTVTDATGRGGVTVTEAVPRAAPLVAVMVTLAGLTPVTVAYASPKLRELSAATVATVAALLVQVTEGWSINVPNSSRTVAVRLIVSPAASTVACAGETATEAGGPAVTTTYMVSDKLPRRTAATAPPSASPVTSPVGETETTAGLSVDHVTG